MLTRNAPHRPALPAGTLLLALLAGSVALVLAVLALTPQTPAPSEVAPTAARAVMNVAPGIEAPDITLEKAPRGLTDYIREGATAAPPAMVVNVAPGIEAPDITLEKAPRGLTDYIRDDER